SRPFFLLFQICRPQFHICDYFRGYRVPQECVKCQYRLNFYGFASGQGYKQLLYMAGQTAPYVLRHFRTLCQITEGYHSLPASERFCVICPYIQEGNMQNTFHPDPLRSILRAFHLNTSGGMDNLQYVVFQLWKGKALRYLAL